MANPNPSAMFDQLFLGVGAALQPPEWAIVEFHQRLVLLLNHVLLQEPQATERLARRSGQVVLLRWQAFTMKLVTTPAGLLALAPPQVEADLTLSLTEPSVFELAQSALSGVKPGILIEGDVQMAAEMNWLVEHVRWDLEEDLSRLIGDVPAHAVAQAVRRGVARLREFAPARQASADGNPNS